MTTPQQIEALPLLLSNTTACCDDTCCGTPANQAGTMDITQAVQARYGAAAADVLRGASASCCGSECCGNSDTISQDLYQIDELNGVPLKAALASLGCGNPTALADLQPGETVLDLGSGGGIDVLLSARRVGPTGFAYGLDMTDSMLELARQNAAEAGAVNVAFLKGDIAAIPLPDASVDIIISNCVINLAADKAPVFKEAFRVLKPGGRFAISDIVIHGGLPEGIVDSVTMRRDMSSWTGCIAGSLTDAEYRNSLAKVGFSQIDLAITRCYTPADVPGTLTSWADNLDESLKTQVIERFASTFVRAVKP